MLIGSHVRALACTSQRQGEPTTQAYNAVLAEFAMQVEQDALIISAEGFMDIDYSLLMSVGLSTVLINSSNYWSQCVFSDIHCHGNLSNSSYAIRLIISKKFNNLKPEIMRVEVDGILITKVL